MESDLRTGRSLIRVGIGGWVFEPWRGTFYPEGLPQKKELEYAASHLTTIEINGTYYGSQKPESFAKWHDETPDDFVFSLKGPRFATNRRVLAEAGESVQRFLGSGIDRLGAKLGPINWQFMATKKYDPDDFGAFLALLPKEVSGLPLRHAVELRHDSFNCESCMDQLRRHGVAAIIAGDSEFPLIADVTADFVYLRVMGTQDLPEGYPPEAVDQWADRARQWAAGKVPDDMPGLTKPDASGGRDVFLYFISGHKIANPAAAMSLIDRLA